MLLGKRLSYLINVGTLPSLMPCEYSIAPFHLEIRSTWVLPGRGHRLLNCALQWPTQRTINKKLNRRRKWKRENIIHVLGCIWTRAYTCAHILLSGNACVTDTFKSVVWICSIAWRLPTFVSSVIVWQFCQDSCSFRNLNPSRLLNLPRFSCCRFSFFHRFSLSWTWWAMSFNFPRLVLQSCCGFYNEKKQHNSLIF